MINDRIFHLIKILELNPTTFSESLDVNVTVIFNIIKGRRSKPSFELILKMLKVYKNLNAEWLVKGEGPMWNEDVITSPSITPTFIELGDRVKGLLLSLRLESPDSYELQELEELVTFIMNESSAQKRKLVLLNERQEGLIRMLKQKLKLRI